MRLFDKIGHAITQHGRFRVRVKTTTTRDLDTGTDVINGFSIHIGGQKNDCVYVTIPLTGSVGQFVRLDSMQGCSLDPPYTVGGNRTVTMGLLALSLVLDLFPRIQTLELNDSASFPCELPDGNKYQLNMTEYELFFKQAAYYERRFGATLINPDLRRMYEHMKSAFTDPAQKPPKFDFKVPELQAFLEPLYNSSSTWKEFAEKIEGAYNVKGESKKCAAVYIWLKSALLQIGTNVSFSGHAWKIHLNPKMHRIQHKTALISGGGASRRSGTRRVQKVHTLSEPRPQEYFAMDWATVLPSKAIVSLTKQT